jgi:hypothetical protein
MDVINPATGEKLATIAPSSDEQIDQSMRFFERGAKWRGVKITLNQSFFLSHITQLRRKFLVNNAVGLALPSRIAKRLCHGCVI